jgi:hypothetical protein
VGCDVTDLNGHALLDCAKQELSRELPEVWRVLSKCHDIRNRTEYEGGVDVDERLVADLMGACGKVAERVKQLPPIPEKSR